MLKKILICAPLPPPKGGIATWVEEIMEANSLRNGVEISVFNTANKRKAGMYSNFRKLKDGAGLLLMQCSNFMSRLNASNIDIVHLSSSGGFAHVRDILFTILAKLKSKKVILQLHYGVNDKEYKWAPFSKLLLYVLNNLVDLTLTLDLDYVNAKNSKKVLLSTNGIKPTKQYVSNQKNKEIVFVGWIIEQKGIFELMDAWNGLSIKNGWQLIIIGPAQETEKKRLESKIDLKNTHYLGELSRDEVIQVINKAQVFALPSHTEGFPFAVLEAMERELALLISDAGGMKQLFMNKKKPGWQTAVGDVSSLGKRLQEIVEDQDLVLEKACYAHELFLQEFTAEKMLEGLTIHWKSIVERREVD